jgi:hypothetical protein
LSEDLFGYPILLHSLQVTWNVHRTLKNLRKFPMSATSARWERCESCRRTWVRQFLFAHTFSSMSLIVMPLLQ